MTANFNAGLDSSDVVLSYNREATYRAKGAGNFKKIRLLSEGFSEQMTRTRPNEIRADGQAAHAIKTQQQAQGSINFGLSYETYDDLILGAINGPVAFPSAPTAVDNTVHGLASSITLGGGSSVGFSRSTGSFVTDGYLPGMWVRTVGFTAAANNGYFRVVSVAATELVVDGPDSYGITAQAGDTDTTLTGSQMARNGTNVETFYFQKKMSGTDGGAGLFFAYPGCYVSGMTLNAQVGGYMEGAFNFLVTGEDAYTTDQNPGGATYVSAPNGRVIDAITGLQDVALGGVSIEDSTHGDAWDTILQGISLNIVKDNARLQFGVGNPQARGMGRGTLSLSGTITVYFRNLKMYNAYKTELDRVVSFRALDSDGAGYIITLPAATFVNPNIVAGGPDTDLVGEFQLEGNPTYPPGASTGLYTIQVDKF